MNRNLVLDRVTVRSDGKAGVGIVNEASMTFQAGKITLLVGRNGAGKTTLLETIAGLRSIDSGHITIGEEPLWQADRKRSNRAALLRMGISLQHAESQWFASTVREELYYSLKPYNVTAEEAERRIGGAMSRMGLSMELLKQDPWTLSGGQQRRLSLASLLASEPDWLLLDEPTAGLDAVGSALLCAALEAHKAAGRGAVVITHDHAALWPLADAVAVMDGGIVREAASPAAALAEAAAGEGAPQALRALAKLRAIGAALPPEAPPEQSGGALWPAPRDVAAALAGQARRRSAPAPAFEAAEHAAAREQAAPVYEPGLRIAAGAAASKLCSPDLFDPRALVPSYFIIAAAVLLQDSGAGLAASALCSLLLLYPVRALLRPWLKLIGMYGMFIIVCGAIAGLSFQPIGFNWTQASSTSFQLVKLLNVMLLGLPMLALTTPFRLQRAIEQSLGWLAKFKLPVHNAALLVTLIFRFIPLLTEEWGRFAKLAHARGKATTPLGSLPIGMIRKIIIPYIRSLLRLAEGMADALEARGFGYVRSKPAFGFRLKLGRADGLLLLAAGAMCSLLILIYTLG